MLIFQFIIILPLRKRDDSTNKNVSLRTILIFSAVSIVPGLLGTILTESRTNEGIIYVNLTWFIETLLYFLTNYYFVSKLRTNTATNTGLAAWMSLRMTGSRINQSSRFLTSFR